MAKITYGAIVTDISGTLGGSVFKRIKGGSIIYNKSRPRNPKSQRQQQTRGYLSYLAGQWHLLNSATQNLWNNYASLSSTRQSGFNAYIQLNLRLLSANHTTLTITHSPPLTPFTPLAIVGETRAYISPTQNRINWTLPSVSSTFTQLFFTTEPGYSYLNKEKWRLVETVCSTIEYCYHTHSYPTGTPLVYYLRSISPNGLISPRSSRLSS